jgi:4-amino-4-deoxy-L-arabinose transferase-like glycosyltransferase
MQTSHLTGDATTRRAKPGWLRDLMLLAAVLGILFGVALGNRALWTPDEGRYVEIPREMVATGDYVTPRLNGVKYFEKPVLFYWLEAGAIRLFGISEWSMRLWPALFALLGCVAVYVAGRQLFDRRAGLLAAAVLATTPLYYLMGRVITLDMAVSVLLTAALLAFLLGVREPPGPARRWYLWGFYALAALATLTKGLIGLVIPAMIIGTWIILLWDWGLLLKIYLPTGLLLFLAVAAPWHILAARANPEFAYFYFVHEHFLRYLTKLHARYQPPWFFVPVLIAGLFPWTVFLIQGIRRALPDGWRDRHAQREPLFLLLWAGLVFAFFSFSDSKLIPYVLPVVPPLALLVGRYLSREWDQPSPRRWRWAFGAMLAVGPVLAIALLVAAGNLPQHPAVADSVKMLGGWFHAIVGALFVLGAVPFVVGWRFHRAGVIATALSSVVFLTVLMLSLPALDAKRSVKELALELRGRLQPADEVISYHAYYQDLPVYLRRRITVVNWQGELEFGMQVEDTSAWMIKDDEFLKRWRGPERAYLFASRSDYDRLRAQTRGTFRPIAQVGDTVLITNKEG